MKKRGAKRDCENDTDQNDKRASMGNVPSAKKSIMAPPFINDPLESAAICIDWVNQQGRKNVPTPTKIGINISPHFFRKNQKKFAGNVNVFWRIQRRFSPSSIMIIEAHTQRIAENTILTPIALPTIPRRPPRTAKLIILAL